MSGSDNEEIFRGALRDLVFALPGNDLSRNPTDFAHAAIVEDKTAADETSPDQFALSGEFAFRLLGGELE